jgi:hypothetical protein
MENQLNQIKDPNRRNNFYFRLIRWRIKEAIEGITPTSLILFVLSIIFASMMYNDKNNFQEITVFFFNALVATIVFFVMVIGSVVLPPTLIKKKISKWDSKYYSDNFTFLIMQILLGIHAYFIAQKYNEPFLDLFIISFFLCAIGLFLSKLYVWARWGRHRE